MTATTLTPTVRDLLTFIYDNPISTVSAVASEFNIDSTDTEELLSQLDITDGTIYMDEDGNYSIENQDEDLEDVLQVHTMGGGQSLDDPLPVKENKPKTKKSQKAQKEDKVTATAAPQKKKAKGTPKAKTKTPKKPKAPKVEIPTEEAPTEDTEAEPVAEAPKPTVKKKAKPKAKTEIVKQVTVTKKAKKGGTQKKATRKSKTVEVAKDKPEKATKKATKKAPKEKKPKEKKEPHVIKPRSSRIIEDKDEAKKLGVKVGDEVKACVDCKVTYLKFGGEFRPRWSDADAKNAKNPDAKASPKHVQPRCINCDKLRSRRKSRFTGLRRMIGVEDIGDPEAIIKHPDRKLGGIPDGKFSVALVDDTVDGMTPVLRGCLVTHAEGLIKLRWASGEEPEIIGATKKAIAATKAPEVVPLPPKPEKAKKKKKATKKVEKKVKATTKKKVKKKTGKAKAATKKATKAKKQAEASAEADISEEKPW